MDVSEASPFASRHRTPPPSYERFGLAPLMTRVPIPTHDGPIRALPNSPGAALLRSADSSEATTPRGFFASKRWNDKTTWKVVMIVFLILAVLGIGIYFLTCWFRKCGPWDDQPSTPTPMPTAYPTLSPTPLPTPTPAPPPIYPLPQNASQACDSLLTIASPFVQQWNQSPIAQNLYANMTGLWTQFCAGARIVDPSTISWGATLMPIIINNLVNQSVSIVTGFSYNPNNSSQDGGIPTRLYTLLSHSLTDFNNTDSAPWLGLKGFYWPAWLRLFSCCINQETLQSGGFLAIKFLCERWQNPQVVFISNTNYTCLNATGADAVIMNFATSANIWP